MKGKLLCFVSISIILLIMLVAIVRSFMGPEEVLIAKVVRCEQKEPMGYMSKNPTTEAQKLLYQKRMSVEKALKEPMGPVYQADTMNAMRKKPVAKEHFTNSFTYPEPPATFRSVSKQDESPFIGELKD